MAQRDRFRIGLVQASCSADPARNTEKTVSLVRDAARRGAQVVCTEELFRSQYFCQTEDHALFDLAEPIPGPTVDRFAALARELGIVVIASLFERRAPGVYHNTAAVIDADGSLAGIYRKMHIPDDPLYHEKFYFTPGDLGFRAFDTRYGRVGVLICWDQWYPEAARVTAMQDVSVLFYPTAIGWHPAEKDEFGAAQADAWRTIQRGHAIANGVYVASVNRVGHEKLAGAGIEFFGGSFVCDPFGRVIAEASGTGDETLHAEVDPALVEETRRHWPFFRDRRIDAYGPLLDRFGR
jgi:N-carbamoylputrescine amidase